MIVCVSLWIEKAIEERYVHDKQNLSLGVYVRHVPKSPVISGRTYNKCGAAVAARISTTPRPIRALVI